jgi:hypothetical protein
MGARGRRRALLSAAAAGAAGSLLKRRAPAARTAAPAGTVYDVTRFGAVANGKAASTRAIQRAIDVCAKAGGGTVLIPPGVFISAPLFLKNDVHLHLAHGATLRASQRFEDFPIIAGRAGGVERELHASLITGIDLVNVTISGRGTLDGDGLPWMDAVMAAIELRKKAGTNLPEGKAVFLPEGKLKRPAPRVVNLIRCQGVRLSDVTVERTPGWTVHLVYCDDVEVDGLRIRGLEKGHFASGIVLDSCRDVRVSNCSIRSGDDGIAIKSGLDDDGRRVGFDSADIVIQSCTVLDSNGAGVAIGSEMSGGVRNVVISNCAFANVLWGVRIKTTRGRGGVVENIHVSNLVIRNARTAGFDVTGLHDRGYYEIPHVATEETRPLFRMLSFSDILVNRAPLAARIIGLPERWFEDISLRDIAWSETGKGLLCEYANRLTLDNLSLAPEAGPAVAAKHCRDLVVHQLDARRARTAVAPIELEAVQSAQIDATSTAGQVQEIVALKGKDNAGIVVSDRPPRPSPAPAADARKPPRN